MFLIIVLVLFTANSFALTMLDIVGWHIVGISQKFSPVEQINIRKIFLVFSTSIQVIYVRYRISNLCAEIDLPLSLLKKNLIFGQKRISPLTSSS